ncbi:PDDEXK nuclease domain-containing protein [Thiothrix lacustris]|uniref:PDDEXK nuclease domain-containing protein n=1 Tax=Thiothrix lacustris TaxID=525917 RepID=UPI0027E3D13F|nr:PDDEXK nuclease domain-containing protein [Thiothrix lacustris]WMP16743.1 PDDEXK nuclease domain-containing protein [Thiothrix lacustris]
MSKAIKDTQYINWVRELKQQFYQAQLKAVIKVNQELLQFYWHLGSEILAKQQQTQWGDGFLTQLSKDLMAEFPAVKGFSKRNLELIRQWRSYWAETTEGDNAIAQQLVSQLCQLPWGHNLAIISKSQSCPEALYYVQNTLVHGWSRAVLVHQIESGLWQREGKATTNFAQTLPATQSDLAQQSIKDPYVFDFLTLSKDYNERELEQSLVKHITQFLLELGSGFAYMGQQVPITVGERDFYLDLLFYHTRLHCHLVIELKITDFEPEHAGKLNFYIKAVDEQLRRPGDEPTIGLLLCKNKDRMVVEYALSDINKPIGVSEYQLTKSLPNDLKPSLPSVEEIEAEFLDTPPATGAK